MRRLSGWSRLQSMIMIGIALSLLANVAFFSLWLSRRSAALAPTALTPTALASPSLAASASDPDLLLQSEMVAAPEEIAVAAEQPVASPEELIRANRPDPQAYATAMVGRWELVEMITPMDGWEMRQNARESGGLMIMTINPDQTGTLQYGFSYQGTSALGDPEPFAWWTDPQFPNAILFSGAKGHLAGAVKLTFHDSKFSLRWSAAVPREDTTEDDGWMIFARIPDGEH